MITHVGTITSSNDQTTVKDELHVTYEIRIFQTTRINGCNILVPLASVPAVEMCSLMSEAGIIISALLTL